MLKVNWGAGGEAGRERVRKCRDHLGAFAMIQVRTDGDLDQAGSSGNAVKRLGFAHELALGNETKKGVKVTPTFFRLSD